MARPSLYDAALHPVARRGIALPQEALERDVAQPHAAHPGVVAAWTEVYRAPETYWELYELAERFVDF